MLVLLVCALLSVASCYDLRDNPVEGASSTLLNGLWNVSVSGGVSGSCSVPGDIPSCWQRLTSSGDPLFEDNWLNLTSDWLQREWSFSTTFTCSKEPCLLVLDGVKLGAYVYLDGSRVATTRSQFRRHTIPVSSPGAHSLELVFPEIDFRKPEIDCEGRFMACSGGWDWAPYSQAFVDPHLHRGFSRGIWKDVYVVEASQGCFIGDVNVQSFYKGAYPKERLRKGSHAGFRVQLEVDMMCFAGASGGSLSVVGSWGSHTSASVSQSGKVELELAAGKDVSLWWPRGSGGSPNLYNLTLSYGKATVIRRVGFRHFALVTDALERPGDGSGTDTMRFKVNGVSIYSRGFNLIPMEELDGRNDPAAQRRMALSVAESGANTVRVWGGGIYPYQVFMDAMDELGLLAYYDMMYTNIGFYQPPHVANSTSEQALEIAYAVTSNSHHPSIIIWDACNECEGQGLYASFVMTTVAKTDKSRAVWPSCPSAGWRSGVDRQTSLPTGPLIPNNVSHAFSDPVETHGPYEHGTGDGFHPINSQGPLVLFPANIPPVLNSSSQTGPRLPGKYASEFGCSAFSSFESHSTQLSPEHWGIHSKPMLERNYACDNIIMVYFGNQTSLGGIGEQAFKRQLYYCMVGQALFLKGDILARRSTNEWGTVIWQLNEIWPTGGWGTIEYGTPGPGQVVGGRWKPVMYWLKAFLFTDLAMACGKEACYVKNDGIEPWSGSVSLQLLSLKDGTTSELHTESVSNLGFAEIHWFYKGQLKVREDAILLINGRPQLLVPPYRLALHPTQVHIESIQQLSSTTANITIQASGGTAVFVVLTTLAEGGFSDNAIILPPSQPRSIIFTSYRDTLDMSILRQSLRIEHL